MDLHDGADVVHLPPMPTTVTITVRLKTLATRGGVQGFLFAPPTSEDVGGVFMRRLA